tara:strand:- start:3296 stop:3421 length:126 start_codon:yes stop_codon:yes gene_type:complete
MEEIGIIEFVMWSGITAILMTITGIIYRSYQRKKSNESFSY